MAKSTPKKEKAKAHQSNGEGAKEHWRLKLYIAGQTPKSLTAFSNLKRFCEDHLPGQYQIEVIDLAKHPELARKDQILAIPTLVRALPSPMRKIVGDLSDKQKVLLGFNLNAIP